MSAPDAAVAVMGLVNAVRFRNDPGGGVDAVVALAAALEDHDAVTLIIGACASVTAAAGVAEAAVARLLADPDLLEAAARCARTIGPLEPRALNMDAGTFVECLSRGAVKASAQKPS